MNDNIYVRSNNSIKTITLTRIIFLLPLIIYGVYKNGIYLYQNSFVNLFNMFRPIILIIIGALIGALVNIIYEKLIKKNKENIIDIIFSSFHLEYGVVLACVSSINTNIFIFTLVSLIIFLLSKFLNNRINTIAIAFIVIYSIQIMIGNYDFANAYELSKTFSLNIFDYLIGRGTGGIATTHIIFLIIALIGLYITNNNKTEISLYSIITYIVAAIIYGIITRSNILELIFLNSYIFIFIYVATDSVTSCYTSNGKLIYGVLIGLLTFLFFLFNPILAPFISIAIVSLLNNLIDRKAQVLKKS